MRPHRPTLLALATLALAAPLAGAAFHEGRLPDAGAQDVNARALNILLYHPFPDPEGDPWGFGEIPRNNTTVGYMEGRYGAYWFPTAVTDGLRKIEGATGFLDTYNSLEADFLARRAMDAPMRLALSGTLDVDAGVAAARLDATPRTAIAWSDVEVRIILFEDEVKFDGGNGVDLHRFVVRAKMTVQSLGSNATNSGPNGTVPFAGMARLNDTWNVDRLGIVASVHHRATGHALFAQDEVLQSATYLFSQASPTIQHSRGVLLEMVSATWCAACIYGDAAIEELANAYGTPSSRMLDREWTYLRPLAAAPLAIAGVVGVSGAALAIARSRKEGRQP